MPTLGHGKICHLELPATDAAVSAAFYAELFGWRVRHSGSRYVFDDGVDEVSGHFVEHRGPTAPGLLVYVMVDDVAATLDRVTAAGGEVVRAIGGDPGEVTARFRDPGGNVLGLYQEPR